MQKVKTIFLGSGEFAVPILKKLLELDFIQLQAVITQPDKPVGRKQVLTPTPVGEMAESIILREPQDDILRKMFDVLKPEKLKTVSDEILEKYKPELIIVASYGQIIPHNMVHYPRFKALNFHGSLLPKLRGAVPVQMAILQGFEVTGTTLQVMEDGMDVGDIISTREYTIKSDDNSDVLMSGLSLLSVEIIDQDLLKWIKGEMTTEKQKESEATYCYKSDLSKDKAEISQDTGVGLADRMIRAFYQWPVAWFKLKTNNKILKIYKAQISYDDFVEFDKLETLSIFRIEKRLFLKLKDGYIELLEIQLEGKNRGVAQDYLFLTD